MGAKQPLVARLDAYADQLEVAAARTDELAAAKAIADQAETLREAAEAIRRLTGPLPWLRWPWRKPRSAFADLD